MQQRIPRGVLMPLHDAERDAVRTQIDISIADLRGSLQDVGYQFLALRETLDYVLFGKSAKERTPDWLAVLDDD